MTTTRISILAYDGCMGMQVFGLCDTLRMANKVAFALDPAAAQLFDVDVISLSGDAVVASGGLSIGARRARRRPDLLVVPGMELSDRAACLRPLTRLAPEIACIARSFARGTPVAGLCVGAFILGEAGLLEGRRATTSWLFAPELAQRFPGAVVDPAAILVEDGGVSTTGSYSAAFDLAVHLVRKAASPSVVRAVARMGLLDDRRTSQAPFIDTRMLTRAEGTFASSVIAWMEQRLAEPYALGALAAAFHVSARTLLRRVQAETGQSPLAHLQQARIGKAKLLLESTSLTVAQVTERVGYGDVATFGSLFRRLAGQPPAEYRRRFRAVQRQQ